MGINIDIHTNVGVMTTITSRVFLYKVLINYYKIHKFVQIFLQKCSFSL